MHIAILLANLLVTFGVFLAGSAITYTCWKDRGLEFDFDELAIVSLVGVALPFLAFLYPLIEVISLGN